uniref:virulence RhuM family protein n=1 Tax=uncultured Dysgonomonas sp. TaxID=206096 RepID=UPI00262DF063|nr:virulence RhuM family protein [uncultured Dysgonomonas sp.]
MEDSRGEIVLYKNEDGTIKIDVLMQDETVWLTQDQMARLFNRDKSVISRHISKIFKDGELDSNAVVAKNATTASDGKVYDVDYYNLDVIISVGYRVNSTQGTQFRIWATQRLKEYIIKGFTLNDERFKTGSSMNYFKELLDRIREIRISEKVFYQQIKDIYATSIDYDPNSKETQDFFKKIQNKFLWAISQQTAAEIIYYRSNAKLPMMGITATGLQKIKKADIAIAKNYLNENELAALKLLVEQYLAFAESQALAQKPMYMKDWIKKLHDILTINDKAVLMDAGRISHDLAVKKVEGEYAQYKEQQKAIEKENSLKALIDDAKKLEGDIKKNRTKKK